MDYLDTLRLVVLNPEQFLKELEKEEKARPAVVFLILSAFFNAIGITIVYFLFFWAITTYATHSSSNIPVWNFVPFILVAVLFTILSFIGWFLYALIIHLLAFLFKRDIKFSRTFQIVAYGSASYFLFSLIPIFGLLSIFYTVYVVAIGIAKFHKLEMPKAVAVASIPLVIWLVVVLLIIFSIFMPLTRTVLY